MKKYMPLLVASLLIFSLTACQIPPKSPDAALTDTTAADTTSAYPSTDTAAETEPEYPMAPDFTVTDGEGNRVSLSDFRGKPVVLNFWASWCPPCKREMPDFETVYRAYGEQVHFLMVNMTDGDRETVELAKAHIESNGYTFPVYFDTAFSAATAYSVYSIPTTYFIDAEGHVITYAAGAIDADTLQRAIGMILPETP